jgi:hypothetical protein
MARDLHHHPNSLHISFRSTRFWGDGFSALWKSLIAHHSYVHRSSRTCGVLNWEQPVSSTLPRVLHRSFAARSFSLSTVPVCRTAEGVEYVLPQAKVI